MVFGTAIYLLGAGATCTSFTAGASTLNNDWTPNDGRYMNLFGISWAENGNDPQFAIPRVPIKVAAGTTLEIFYVARSTFGGGTCKAYGFLRAERAS